MSLPPLQIPGGLELLIVLFVLVIIVGPGVLLVLFVAGVLGRGRGGDDRIEELEARIEELEAERDGAAGSTDGEDSVDDGADSRD